jgi:hypothetical protein
VTLTVIIIRYIVSSSSSPGASFVACIARICFELDASRRRRLRRSLSISAAPST